LTPEAVERFKLELAQSRSKATVNRHLALLRHLFNRAIRRGYQGRNPVSAVGLFREENTRSRWLTEDEERIVQGDPSAVLGLFPRGSLHGLPEVRVARGAVGSD